ncbi:MAG: hypothetical protein KBS70_05730 [Bacteroidales bacterium]|nr:hypothetical protein [Candidatus Colicola equi]
MFSAEIKNINGSETVKVYNYDEYVFPALMLEEKASNRQKKQYYNIIITADTETSKVTETDADGIENPVGCWVYQWAVKFGECDYIAGRTAEELILFFRRIITEYNLDTTKRIVIWFHNAAYDLSYLINGLYQYFVVDLFAMSSRKVVKCTLDGCLEIRCSWKLVNKSLAAWCKDVKPYHIKQVGEIDYNTVRTPASELTKEDWNYMLNDVASQYDCLKYELKNETIATVPMTSTGFVRRAMREASKKETRWKSMYKAMLLTPSQYKLIKNAFTGGYTHCNSWDLGIHHNCCGFDAESMYPAVMATEKYPMTKFKYKHIADISELDEICSDGYYCVVMSIYVENLRLHDIKTWNPYISYSKVDGLTKEAKDTVELDNGKVTFLKAGILYLTEIDYKWMRNQYDFDSYTVISVMISKADYLPAWFRDELKNWYNAKTQLKGVEGDTEEETDNIHRRYMESKAKLNACYGLTATDIIRDEYSYDQSTFSWSTVDKHVDTFIAEQIEKMKLPWSKDFLPYQWGVYVTAHSRNRLFTVAEACESPLYCDTDSVKGYNWNMEKLKAINDNLARKAEDAGFTAFDAKGNYHTIGVFTDDGFYSRFSALHAKCYAYEDADGKLHATIAGVTKDNGQPYGSDKRVSKEMELGRLENLHDGKRFVDCGGTRSVYMDSPHDIIVNGEKIHSYGGCCILPTTYEIGGTVDLLAEYEAEKPELAYL